MHMYLSRLTQRGPAPLIHYSGSEEKNVIGFCDNAVKWSLHRVETSALYWQCGSNLFELLS